MSVRTRIGTRYEAVPTARAAARPESEWEHDLSAERIGPAGRAAGDPGRSQCRPAGRSAGGPVPAVSAAAAVPALPAVRAAPARAVAEPGQAHLARPGCRGRRDRA